MSGDTDFCSIELDGGAVVLRIDLGSGEASVRSPPGVVFNDLNWHKVSANENPPTDSTAALDFSVTKQRIFSSNWNLLTATNVINR